MRQYLKSVAKNIAKSAGEQCAPVSEDAIHNKLDSKSSKAYSR